MIKKLIATLLSLSVALSLCACGDKDSSSSKADSSSAPDTTTTTTTTTAATTAPTTTTTTITEEPQPEPVNRFDFEGFEMEDAKTLGGNKDLNLTAMIDLDGLTYGGDEITYLRIENITDDNILLRLNFKTADGDIGTKLVCIDKESYEVISELECDFDNTSIEYLSDGIIVSDSEKNYHKYTVYDSELSAVKSFESTGYNKYLFTDINTGYYMSYTDSQLYRYDVISGKSEKISDSSEYYVTGLNSVDKIGGKDIAIISTVEEDHKNRNGVLDTTTGEISYLDGNGYLNINNGILTLEKYDENYSTEYSMYATSIQEAVKVNFDSEDYYVSQNTDSDRILSYTYKDYVFYFELFDVSEGAVIGCCTLDAKDLFPDEEEARKKLGVDADYDLTSDLEPYLSGTPRHLDDDTLIMCFENTLAYQIFVEWDISNQSGFDSKLVATECDTTDEFYSPSSIDQIYTILQPSQVSEKYKPLREKADRIEEKYGIEILIENEAVGYMGDYILENSATNIFVYDPYETLNGALDCLDRELARYPEGFLAQVSNDGCEDYRFLLTGQIVGINKANAGGFKYAIDDNINIVISVAFSDISGTLHHELSHSIDYYVEEKLKGTVDFSAEWQKLNPADDPWYGEVATQEEIFAECIALGTDPSGAYYYSDYGHTNATEDRATIFSAVMTPPNFLQPELERAPFIVAKLNFYAECINLAFDGSENWGDMPWEKYMD